MIASVSCKPYEIRHKAKTDIISEEKSNQRERVPIEVSAIHESFPAAARLAEGGKHLVILVISGLTLIWPFPVTRIVLMVSSFPALRRPPET